ncbi:MAG: ABC transporter permease [Candidatus Bipolaricaulota bacterium]|nr:ABC transporter permease [Candidatus Bipolaricaulota bacterium]MDW8126639.1 ABC transporter permease [Candidatus Bipolaricaulota bacterium]
MRSRTEYLIAAGVVFLILGLWEAVVRLLHLPPFVLPAPSQIFLAFARDFPLLLYHAKATLVEVGLGLGIGTTVGAVVAVLAFYFRPVGKALTPFLVGSQVIPIFAVAPLLVLWFGFGIWPKVAVATMIVFFPVAVNFLDGLRSLTPELVEFFQALGAPEFRIFWMVRVPGALPFLFSALRVGVTLALVGATIGEWVGANRGLGYLMIQANARLRLDRVFAAILTLTLLGLGLFWAIGLCERLFPRRR